MPLNPTSTQKIQTIKKHILTQAQYDQLVSDGYVTSHPYEEYYITDANNILNELDDVNITNPTNGQNLVYDIASQKWINGSGSGSGITTLTSPVRIWDLEPGLYILPPTCVVYINGASSTSSITIYGGILNVYYGYSNTLKRWDCWEYNGSTSSLSTPGSRYAGSTTSSSGNCTLYNYLTSQRSSTNNSSYDFGHHYYDNLTNFNTVSNYLLASGSCRGYMSSSCSNKPVNLTLSGNTYFHLFVYNSYSNTSYTNVSGYYIRQDLYLPTLNKHYYRLIQYYNSTITPNTSITGADSAGWVELENSVAAISDLTDVNLGTLANGNILQYDSSTSKWVNSPVPSGTVPAPTTADTYLYSPDGSNFGWASIGSITGHDYTHQPDSGTAVSGSQTITYAANIQGSKKITAGGNLILNFVVNNSANNLLWIENNTGSTVDIAINSVTKNNVLQTTIFRPNGISVDDGYVCEIGIIVNVDGVFITYRNDLELQA